jgi:prevent-host-death family protein
LSEFLRAVKTGEEIIVTERGAPIARLGPLEASSRLDARLRSLVEMGLARPPRAKLPKGFWDRPLPSDPEGVSLRALLEERDGGR